MIGLSRSTAAAPAVRLPQARIVSLLVRVRPPFRPCRKGRRR